MEGQPAVAAEGKKIRIKPEKKRKSKRGEKREENVKKKIRSTSLPAELFFLDRRQSATVNSRSIVRSTGIDSKSCHCQFEPHQPLHNYLEVALRTLTSLRYSRGSPEKYALERSFCLNPSPLPPL